MLLKFTTMILTLLIMKPLTNLIISVKGKEPAITLENAPIIETEHHIENTFNSYPYNSVDRLNIDDLADDLRSISVSSNCNQSNSDFNNENQDLSKFTKVTKRKNKSEYNLNSKRIATDINHSLNIIPLKHKIKDLPPTLSKKSKPNPKTIPKRPCNPVSSANNKKYKISMDNFEHSANEFITDTPLTYKQAITCNKKESWIKTIKEELQNFYDNNIMTFVRHLPKGKFPISSKWIFTIKRDSNGNIIKFKARLVARGFYQKRGIDFELTFSPTLNLDSLKLIIALASKFCWNIMQMDIKAAYLNAPLDKELYITIPPGSINFGKGYWRLNKALCDLKQSGRQWYIHFTNFLKNNKFSQLISEPCIFKKLEGGRIV